MRLVYKNKKTEKILIAVNCLASAIVVSCFVLTFGFEKMLINHTLSYILLVTMLAVFTVGKFVRLFNCYSRLDYLKTHWAQIPLLLILIFVVAGCGRWFACEKPFVVRYFAIGIYNIVQVLIKICRAVVDAAASGKNPTKILSISFLVLILAGAGLLMLPKSSAHTQSIGFVDALFTSTSATCVTGLIVLDTGKDFSLMGQMIILSLIQLGGLGIVLFGAILALLLGQALTLRESVAMKDLLSTSTISRIGNMIAFIFVGTVVIEILGALAMFGLFDRASNVDLSLHQKWFYSIFHSISAFCNAGFSLFGNSFIGYKRSWQIYAVICPLIILGGLGFGVLYNLFIVGSDKIHRFIENHFNDRRHFLRQTPKPLMLQTKIVLVTTLVLIVAGMVAILVFEHYSPIETNDKCGLLGAMFQSITARTAGFNTVNINHLSAASKTVLILLMFIGGSPGSTAGGIKTVTAAVILLTVVAALRKRSDVEVFKRSIKLVVIGRAVTVVVVFAMVLFLATFALSVTESSNHFGFDDIIFEAASALGTVGLSTGITAALTTAGKFIIIMIMLIGRLGPLTLLAVLTFNIKPAKYSYPDEAIMVG